MIDVDAYFLADNTVSMEPFITATKAGAGSILGNLTATSLYTGGGAYRDRGAAGFVFRNSHSLQLGKARAQQAITAWATAGNPTESEAQLWALYQESWLSECS